MSGRTRKQTEKGKLHAADMHKAYLMTLKHQESKKQNKEIDELAGLMGTRMKFGGRRKRKTRRRSRK